MSAGIVHVYFLQVGTTNHPCDQSGEKNAFGIQLSMFFLFVCCCCCWFFLQLPQQKKKKKREKLFCGIVTRILSADFQDYHLDYHLQLHSNKRFIHLGGEKINK